MSEHTTKKIALRHAACDGQNFEPFKIWANGLAAHIDRGILLRRLEAAELRARLEIRKVRSWRKWIWRGGDRFPRRKVLGFRYFLDGREVDIHGNSLEWQSVFIYGA